MLVHLFIFNFGKNSQIMKRILVILCSVLIACTSFAQGKVIKSSDPKAPIWLKKDVNKHEAFKTNYISQVSLEDAKECAFEMLRQNVINTTLNYMLKNSVGGANADELKAKIENSTYVKNISEAASLDTYWEIRFDKRSKTNYYEYHLLYYYNEMEMKKISLELNHAATNTKIDF